MDKTSFLAQTGQLGSDVTLLNQHPKAFIMRGTSLLVQEHTWTGLHHS